MKKTVSSLLLVVLALTMVFTLASCGLSGTYEGALFDLKFSGKNVTVIAGENELKGTYEIKEDGDKKTISFDFVDEDKATEEEKAVLDVVDKILGANLNFVEDGDTITIAYAFKFTKK